MFDPVAIVAALNRHGVKYVGIGMFAAVLQGAAHDTEDIDISYEASRENVQRLVAALAELEVRFRIDAYPQGLDIPGGIDVKTIANTTSLALVCEHGNLDVVLLPDGTRGYEDLVRDARSVPIADGVTMPVSSLRDIIRSKEAAGREKDRAVLPALRRLASLADWPSNPAQRSAAGDPRSSRRSPKQVPGRPPLAEILCRSAQCSSGGEDEPARFYVPGTIVELGAQPCPYCGQLCPAEDARQLEGVDLVRGWYLHERRR